MTSAQGAYILNIERPQQEGDFIESITENLIESISALEPESIKLRANTLDKVVGDDPP